MINKIKKLINSSDKRTLIENFISLSALQIIGMLLPLITLPYILKTIGFEKYGLIVFASSLVAYFTSLTDFSFRITATREVAISKHSLIKLNLIYSKVMIIKALFLLMSWLIIFIVVLCVPSFKENWIIYFYCSLLLFGYVLFPEWFFQGIEKMKYITFLNLGIKLIFTLSVFVFIKSERDFYIYPLIQSGGYILAGLVGQFILLYKYKLKLYLLPKRHVLQTIKKNFPLFVNQFVPTLYNNTSTFLLGIFGTEKLVGIYQAILTIVNLGVTVIEIFSRVFFPFLNRMKSAFKKYLNLMLGISISIILFMLLLNRFIFWYLDVTYDYAFEVLFILLIGLFGYTLSNVFGLNYFIVHRKDTLVMKITIIASVIGFLMSFPLIHYFSILGAAINLSLARCIMGGGLLYKYFTLKINKNENSRLSN